MWTHHPTQGCTPRAHSLWATSLVWCTRTWSMPPVWMSKRSPRYFVAMAEHSMCQPGNPRPHGESHSCWRCTPGGVSFQRAKSAGWRLASICSTRPLVSELVEVEAGEVGVGREAGRVEVHAVVDHVGVALRLEGADHRDLLVDVGGRRRADVRLEAAEAGPVGGPLLGVEGGDLRGGLARRRRRLLHLVVALVGVADEVADVGDVGDEGDVVGRRHQHPAEEVRDDLAAHVAEVLRRVDGRPAGVDADLRRRERRERPDRSGAGVVEAQGLEAGRRGRGELGHAERWMAE